VNRTLPDPDDLDRNPELAVLAVLHVALEAARAALLAVHEELRGPEDPPPVGWLTPARAALALTLLCEAASSHISLYHGALEDERLHQLDQSARRDF
jgi:hypothetical protein